MIAMKYTSLLDYIRDNPDQLKAEIWSAIRMAIDFGEPVDMALPRTLDEYDQQFSVLMHNGLIASDKGRWRATQRLF
jgi:hypothetical protein